MKNKKLLFFFSDESCPACTTVVPTLSRLAREQGIAINEVRVCGGGAKSALWCKILANVLRVKVVKTNCSEGPSFGAAILAMVASGEFKSVKEATDSLVKVTESINYDEDIAKKYDKGYEKFADLYKCLKEWYKK